MVSPQAGSGDGTLAVKERSPDAGGRLTRSCDVVGRGAASPPGGWRPWACDRRPPRFGNGRIDRRREFVLRETSPLSGLSSLCAGFRVIDTTVVGSLPTEPKC